jgi:ribulose-5-phosphate 4-epimerase/fuculose-1-phosphate aldolase
MGKNGNSADDEQQLRIDLAAVFRLTARMNWHEAVENHFSVAVSPDGSKFLMNPRWKHFSRMKASDLILLDANDAQTMERPDAPEATAWFIHGRIHAQLPQARCVLHVHSRYATAIASLADPEIKPIDQNTARFYNRVSIDQQFAGFADHKEEGDRLARALRNRSRLIMGNHGVLIVASTVAEAFDDLYYFERACQTLVLAYSTGQKLSVLSDEIAERTALMWDAYRDAPLAHFSQMKSILDDEEPSYAQ